MKTEEATCKVAPSPTQISYPLYNVKDGVIEDSPHTGVTCSPCSIESPQTQKLYITPPPQKPKKEDIRADCLGYLAKVKGIPASAKNLMTWLSNRRRWKEDGLIIISFAVTARHFNMSERQIIRLYKCLEKHNCIRVVKRGGLRGDKREANYYALGSFFDARPPKESEHIPMTKMSEVREVIPMTKMSDDLCQECHSLPIVSPYKNTHTEELPSAFNKENWLNRGKAKYPNWDADNMTSAFYSGEMKGLNGNWPSFQDKCYHLRITSAKTTPAPAPRSWQKQPSKPPESSCESPKSEPIDYVKSPEVFVHDLYTALKNGETTACILSAVKDPALRESGLAKARARIEASKSVAQSLRFVMASTTTHPKPSKEAWIKECVRLGIEESKSSDSYEQLNRAGWLMSDGSVIKNWKQYANGIGKGEARRKAKTS